jgi:adenine-specific DNA methylase
MLNQCYFPLFSNILLSYNSILSLALFLSVSCGCEKGLVVKENYCEVVGMVGKYQIL